MLCLESPVFSQVRSSGYRLDAMSGKIFNDTKSRSVEKSLLSIQSDIKDFPEFLRYYLELFPFEVRYASGDDIHAVFEKYRPGSCMRYSEKRDLREFYANNPDKIGVYYNAKSDHPLLTSHWSALAYIGKSGKLYLDRLYSSGFCHSSIKGHLASAIVRTCGKSVKAVHSSWLPHLPESGNLVMTFDHDSSEPLPFLDSFGIKSYTCNTVTLTTNTDDMVDNCDDVDGTCPDGTSTSRIRCCCCNCRLDEDDYRSNGDGDLYCDSCFSDNYSYCEYTEVDYPINDVSNVEVYWSRRYHQQTVCSMTINDDSLRSDFTQTADGSCVEYVHDDDRIELANGDYICPEDLEDGDFVHSEYDDEYLALEDAVWCEDIESYRDRDNCTEFDGQWYGDADNLPVEYTDELWENVVGEFTNIAFVEYERKFLQVHYKNGIFAIVGNRDNPQYFKLLHSPSGLFAGSLNTDLAKMVSQLDYAISQIPIDELEYLATVKVALSNADYWNKTQNARLYLNEIGR